MDDSKLLKSRIADRIRQAEEGFYITNTDFLDLHQQALAREECRGHYSGFMVDMKTRSGAF